MCVSDLLLEVEKVVARLARAENVTEEDRMELEGLIVTLERILK